MNTGRIAGSVALLALSFGCASNDGASGNSTTVPNSTNSANSGGSDAKDSASAVGSVGSSAPFGGSSATESTLVNQGGAASSSIPAIATGGVLATGTVANGGGGNPGAGGTKAASSSVATVGGSPGGASVGGAPTTASASLPKGGSSATGGTRSAGGNGGRASGGTTTSVGGTSASPSTLPSAGSNNTSGCGKAAPTSLCSTSATGPCTIDINGLSREYFVVLPANYNPDTAYPVVYAWHYLGGTAAGLLPSSGGYGGGGFYGVQKGFPNAIYVAAQGLDTSSSGTGTEYGWPNTSGRDVNLAKALVASINSNFCVDQNRLFAIGMSYGGMMSDTLACQMPDVYRAIAVMAGSLGFGSYAPSCVNHPIAAWFTHGDADKTVPIDGDIRARDLLIKNNGCNTANTEDVVLNTTTTCTLYKDCSAGAYPVVWCPVVGGGHTIPSFSGTEIAKFLLQF